MFDVFEFDTRPTYWKGYFYNSLAQKNKIGNYPDEWSGYFPTL